MGNSNVAPGKIITFELSDETECKITTTKGNMYAKLKNKEYDTRSPVNTIDNTIDIIYKEVERMNISGDIDVRNLDLSKEKISKEELLNIIKNTDRSGFFSRYDDGGKRRRRRRSEVDMLTS